jgi:hypothetical protein
MKENKSSTVMVGEAIVSFSYGMDSHTKKISMIAYLLDFGEKMLNKRQVRLFSLDI